MIAATREGVTLMFRLFRRLVVLAVVGAAGVAAYNYAAEHGWARRSRAAAYQATRATEQTARLADRAADKASAAATKIGARLDDSSLTAKIKSKMALDDHVNARAIDVDTLRSEVTLTGTVASADERQRALRLARDTEGVTRVVDRLVVRKN
jgi:osmotically-inducible protein OsmY